MCTATGTKITDAQRVEYANVILRSGETLLALLNDILDLSRVEAGRLAISTSTFAPAVLVAEALEAFREPAVRKGLDLRTDPPTMPTGLFVGDPLRLRQMLSNYLSNAVKFTSAGSVNLGATVEFAEDGQLAVDAVTSGRRYAIVLMDVQMPVLDGLAATRRIRQWESGNGRSRVPIVAVSSGVFEDQRQQCVESGMDDFIGKPVVIDELVAALNRSLASRTPPRSPTWKVRSGLAGSSSWNSPRTTRRCSVRRCFPWASAFGRSTDLCSTVRLRRRASSGPDSSKRPTHACSAMCVLPVTTAGSVAWSPASWRAPAALLVSRAIAGHNQALLPSVPGSTRVSPAAEALHLRLGWRCRAAVAGPSDAVAGRMSASMSDRRIAGAGSCVGLLHRHLPTDTARGHPTRLPASAF